jgi:Icc-related predicted phosphoesterase
MKLYIVSDLHLEFGGFEVPDVDADVVVVAGDLHTGTRGLRWAHERLPDVPILYVLGNHEYYGHSTPGLVEDVRAAAATLSDRITLLDCDSVEIDGVRFIGAALWSDFELFGDAGLAMIHAGQSMSDYRTIRVDAEHRALRPGDTLAMHRREVKWLSDSLLSQDDGRVVVVTHHAPSMKSVPSMYANDLVSAAFASNLDDLVESSGAELWIHGHTHHASDYWIGSTRVLSNPRGYVGREEVPGFRPDLVVDV